MFATTPSAAQDSIPLYPGLSVNPVGGRDKRPVQPQMFHYPSGTTAGRPAILICPGGGYTGLAMDHEGHQVAAYFNTRGFDAFVLMYRLNDAAQTGSRHPAQHEDVTTAMRIIKSKASALGIDPAKTGILGFSAGGHLASMGATMPKDASPEADNPLDRIDSRPAFAILVYPVISLKDSFAHRYSAAMLLGKEPAPGMADNLSTYNRVTPNTPPTFIVFSSDDRSVPPQNGIVFYEALLRNKVKAALHIFDHGGHGYGMAPKDPVLNQWPGMAVAWLAQLGMAGSR
jgi:acetyl esterase/lipase